jgi:hypothetical protein
MFAKRLQCQPLEGQWVCDFEVFVKILKSKHISAPGPDGIAPCFWARAPEDVYNVLYSFYLHPLQMEELPEGFNHSLFVFVLKTLEQEDTSFALCRKAENEPREPRS